MFFSPFLGWVDVPDPSNPPAGARAISASDLLRYERGLGDAAEELNTVVPRVDALDTAVGDLQDDVTRLGGDGQRGYIVRETAGRTVAVWDYLNAREQIIYGDTGWRKVANSAGVTGDILLRRQGTEVTLRLVDVIPSPSNAFLSQETGGASFRPVDGARNEFITGLAIAGSDYTNLYLIHAYRYGFVYKGRLGGGAGEQPALGLTVQIKWTTDGTWPTSLPGTPA